jgi:hypothetical protein
MDGLKPRKGEKISSCLDDLIFLGQGIGWDKSKHFIFEDPIDELFVIKKETELTPDLCKKLEALAK